MLLVPAFALSLALACSKDPEPQSCPATTVTASGTTLAIDAGDCGSATLQAEVVGSGELSVELVADGDAITPVVSGTGTLEGVVLSGDWQLAGSEDAVLWRQGYQSWWFSGVVELASVDADPPSAGGDGDGLSATQETAWSSWWVGLVGRPDGQSLLLGALSAQTTKFYTAFEDGRAWAVWGLRGEQLAVDGSLHLDPLYADLGYDPNQLHEGYAQAAAEQVGVPDLGPRPALGWSTWYVFYEDVTEEQVRANLDLGLDLDLFQVDDGWEVLWGDWTANEKFPSGMEELASDIADAGYQPGLWMAPLYVHRDTDTYRGHPDWWVYKPDGSGELSFSNVGSGDYAVLDITNPEAADWLAELIAGTVAQGWTYLKLDFLFAGAQEGARYQDMTGAQAYKRALDIMREAAGDDTFILACGAPMLPSLGWAQAYRTGADIAFNADPDPRPEYLRWQARATAARGWQNGVWWWIDPDAVLVREPFDEVRATGSIAAQAASGGAWLLGDDLSVLDPSLTELALGPADLRGISGHPVDPLRYVSGLDLGPLGELAVPNDTVPVVWQLDDGSTVLLNMGDEAVQVEAPAGSEWFSGDSGGGVRTLESGQGEIWR